MKKFNIKVEVEFQVQAEDQFFAIEVVDSELEKLDMPFSERKTRIEEKE